MAIHHLPHDRGLVQEGGDMESKFDRDAVIRLLNKIMELELAGVVRYTHYALMVYGYNRIPIVDWLQKECR
jgi:bacterioferritin (cytochrome b1)